MSISDNGLSMIWSKGYDRLAMRLATMIPNTPDSTVLEMGCGRGQLTLPLASSLKGRIIAVDRSKRDVEMLEEALRERGFDGRVETMAVDACDIELEDGVVDAAVSNFFFGWIDEGKIRRVIQGQRRILKEGGVMLHSDFLPKAENQSQAVAIEQGRAVNNQDPSVKWWTPEELCTVIKHEGFLDINVFSFDWRIRFDYHMAARQLERWGAKKDFIRRKEGVLKAHGMELPKSYIVQARKPGV